MRILCGVVVACVALLAGCAAILPAQPAPTWEGQAAGSDANRGRSLIRAYGCHTCHTVPGVVGADAVVGPPLNNWASRSYIVGRMENRSENMILWLMNPQAVVPGTAMPNLNVSEADARDMSAYLYTLGGSGE